MPLSRRRFLAGSTAAGLLYGDRARGARRGDRPNLLILFPDQLRAQSLSLYGERNIRTPVFDELLSSGVHFRSAYSPDPVCAPARAALLTGLMPHAAGVLRNGQGLPTDLPTFASVLRDAGYATAYVGKWHLHDSEEHPGFVPRDHRGGFRWFAGYNVSHRYRQAVYYINGKRPVRPDPEDRFEPEFQVDLALGWLKRNKQPFALMVSFGPPHPPGTAPIDDWSKDLPPGALKRVDRDAIVLPPNVPDWMAGPNRGPDGTGPQEPGARHHLQGYYASILALEKSVERLLDGLEELGLAGDTVVVLASDHGELGGAHGQYQKGEPYEESVRVPLGFRMPGTLRPREVGALASTIDVFPTLLGLAGVEPPEPVHGADLGRWLAGREGPDRDGLMIQGKLGKEDTWRMLRTDGWSYAEWPHSGRRALFDMAADPYQQHDLIDAPEHEKVRADLQARLANLREELGDRTRKPRRRRSGGRQR